MTHRTMKSWLPKLLPYSDQNTLEGWAKIRARGQARFVIESGLSLAAVVFGIMYAIRSIFFEAKEMSVLQLSLYIVVGMLGATSRWRTRETEYQKALREAGVKALPDQDLAK